MSTLGSSIVAGLIVAAVIGLGRLRWLYLAVPKLSLYTKLSDGQVVSMTLLNMGFRPEETVEIHLRPQARYEILACTRNDVTLDATTAKIVVPRISRLERTTILLLVEGGVWDKSWVTSVSSKDTTAKIIERTEQVATPAQFLVVILMLGLLAGMSLQFGSVLGRENQRTVWDYVYSKYVAPASPIKPAKITWRGSLLGSGDFGKRYSMESLPFSVVEMTRSGDTVTLTLAFTNELRDFYKISVETKGSADDANAISFDDRYISDLVIFPGETKRRSLEALLPIAAKQKLIIIEYRVNFETSYATVSEELRFD